MEIAGADVKEVLANLDNQFAGIGQRLYDEEANCAAS